MFFREEELENVDDTWGKRKSAGPDGLSYEGLRPILRHSERWNQSIIPTGVSLLVVSSNLEAIFVGVQLIRAPLFEVHFLYSGP